MRPFLLWLSDAYKMISFWGIDCSFCQMMWTLPTMLSYVPQSLMKIDSIVRMRFVHTHTCQIMLKISHKVNSERCFCLCIYLFIFKTTFLLQTIFDFNDRRTRVCKDTFQKWSMDWNSFIKLRVTKANTNIQVKMVWKVST